MININSVQDLKREYPQLMEEFRKEVEMEARKELREQYLERLRKLLTEDAEPQSTVRPSVGLTPDLRERLRQLLEGEEA